MHGDFINDQIFIETLPQLDEVEFKPLQGSYKYVMLVKSIIHTFSLLIFFTLFVSIFLTWTYVLLIVGYGSIVLYGIVHLILRYLAFYKKGYALRDQDIIYKTGLFWKQQLVIPFSRIQHCQIKEGPIDSLLELAKLEVYTAGGSGSDLLIPGLRPTEAMQLRELIIKETSLEDTFTQEAISAENGAEEE